MGVSMLIGGLVGRGAAQKLSQEAPLQQEASPIPGLVGSDAGRGEVGFRGLVQASNPVLLHTEGREGKQAEATQPRRGQRAAVWKAECALPSFQMWRQRLAMGTQLGTQSSEDTIQPSVPGAPAQPPGSWDSELPASHQDQS